jgi:hypothetical protein
LGAAAAGCLFAPRFADAQAKDPRLAIGDLARRTAGLLYVTVDDGGERPDTAVTRFETQQREISPMLANIINPLKEEEQLQLTTPREYALALSMVQHKVPLAPPSTELDQSIKRPLPSLDPAPQDTLLDVLLDIFMDALGIKELGKVAKNLILADTSLKQILMRIGNAVRAKQYGEAALQLERLLAVLASPRVMILIEQQVGEKAVRQILTQFATRFVPFIGWGYTVTCLLVSIYHNREKLAKLL